VTSSQVRIGVAIAVIVVAVTFVIEARVSGGVSRQCTVTEAMSMKRTTQLFLRCEKDLIMTSVAPIAALVHGTPHVGQTIRVLVDDDDDATWDKPAARHPLSAIFAMFAVIVGVKLAWRRLSSG
jgi:hypothetical protein